MLQTYLEMSSIASKSVTRLAKSLNCKICMQFYENLEMCKRTVGALYKDEIFGFGNLLGHVCKNINIKN